MSSFNENQWTNINSLFKSNSTKFGAPKIRQKSVVIGAFNIRKLGSKTKRSEHAWNLLAEICKRFDLLAIQEVMDDLEGLRYLHSKLGSNYGMVVSDVTGKVPGRKGNAERLAFIFNWKKIRRTELASDISFDRTDITQNLFENRASYNLAWDSHNIKLGSWKEKVARAKAENKRSPSKPPIELPLFLTFIRQPHCASFEIVPKGTAQPHCFIAVNAHLLYGKNPKERKMEFDALIEWLNNRAKMQDKLFYKNIVLLGDCNLEFSKAKIKRDQIEAQLKKLNNEVLTSKKAAKVNFPLLDPHPKIGYIKTNLRKNQTYDQIAIYAREKWLPNSDMNKVAGQLGPDKYDYGVIDLRNLLSQALFNKDFKDLTSNQTKKVYDGAEHEISDHLPIWFRLPIPGA